MQLYLSLPTLFLSIAACNGAEKSPIVAEMEAVAFGTYQLIHPENTEKADEQKNLAAEAARHQSVLKTRDYLIEIGVPSEHAFCYAAALASATKACGYDTPNIYFAPSHDAPQTYAILTELYEQAGIEDQPPAIIFFAYRWPNTKVVSPAIAYAGRMIVLDYWEFTKLSPNEQIAVIAHEVGHIASNHGEKSVEREALCAQTSDEQLQRIYSHTKQSEFDADLLAVEMLSTEKSLITFLEKRGRYAPKGASPSPEWYTEYERYLSHPAPERRIAALKDWAKNKKNNAQLNT